MRIRLKNFRCYTDETFDFGSDGIALLSGPSGKGKCLAKNTEILMYDGSICMSQNIQLGDLIMGPDSKPRRVMSICSGVDELYMVKPFIGKTHTINSNHILTLFYNGNLVDISLQDYQKIDPINQRLYQLVHIKVVFPEKPVDQDPYLVGKELCGKIPDNYKINCKKIRYGILCGILDSKAIKSESNLVIHHTNEEFIKDISFVANSLGVFAVTKTHDGVHSVTIYHDTQYNIQPFTIIPVGTGEYYGFELNRDGRFLLGDFTVTHNSSILMGIHFALNGAGSKVVTHGKTSCLVEFEFDGMKITRTKRPNRLVVNDIYEDEAAQEVINKKFGDAFDVSGYIAQNAMNSFILMSPIEKLNFLEKFAFKDINLAEIKARCKAHISRTNEELISTSSQLEMAQNILDKMDIPIEVKFPLGGKTNKELAIKNENTRYKNAMVRKKKHEKAKQTIETELNDFRVLEAYLTSKQESLESVGVKLEETQESITEILRDFDQEALSDAEKMLTFLIANKKVSDLHNQIQQDTNKLADMRQTEILELTTKISDIGPIWEEMSQEELTSVITDSKQCLSDLKRLDTLRRDLPKNVRTVAEIEAELEEQVQLNEVARMQQGLYKCPCCSVMLRINDGKLLREETSVDHALDIAAIKQKITKLKQELIFAKQANKIQESIDDILGQYDELPTLEETQQSIRYHQELLDTNLDKERKFVMLNRALAEQKFSSSYQSFAKNIQNMSAMLEKEQRLVGDTLLDVTQTEDELRDYIMRQKHIRDQLRVLKQQQTQLTQERNKLLGEVTKLTDQHAEKFGIISDIDTLQSKIFELDSNIQEETKLIETHDANLKLVELWEKYQKELDTYTVWKTKVEALTNDEQICKSKYAAATMLKDKILEAESTSMINIIESINTHAHLYLEYFFPDNPIIVRLKPFRETKKGTEAKPQISIDIEYKGMECDLNTLSGGELSRVILAYTLALAEIFNAPLLLLDECTASLDQELTSVVFEAIREHFNGKMTVIIAHQVITGTFDKIIKLSEED